MFRHQTFIYRRQDDSSVFYIVSIVITIFGLKSNFADRQEITCLKTDDFTFAVVVVGLPVGALDRGRLINLTSIPGS